jgi:hypothetical protein
VRSLDFECTAAVGEPIRRRFLAATLLLSFEYPEVGVDPGSAPNLHHRAAESAWECARMRTMMQPRRLPCLSAFASQRADPEPGDFEPRPKNVTQRQSLMDMVRAEQEKHAAAASLARSSSRWNFWSGVGCFALSFLPHGIGAALWVLAVIFWSLAFWQWMGFICDRRAARAMPQPEGMEIEVGLNALD